MLVVLRKRWWVIALRGALGIVFGLAALAWPRVTLDAIVLLFGAYVFADGLIGALLFVTREDPMHRPRLVLLLEALAGVAAGVIAFLWPSIPEMMILAIIAFWALLTGMLEFAAASALGTARGALLLRLCGLASVVLGVAVLVRPSAGVAALGGAIGVYALAFGALFLSFGLWLRSHQNDSPRPHPLAVHSR